MASVTTTILRIDWSPLRAGPESASRQPATKGADNYPVAEQNLESALLVTVPSAEPVVARYRDRLDSSAPLGVPAHITVLFPFMPPAAIGAQVHARLARLFAAVAPFVFALDHTDWFGDHLLWLGPRDPAPFSALTRLVHEAFPDYPPYGGRHDVVVPHLTVADTGDPTELRAADDAVRPRLPVEARATQVALMTGPPTAAEGRWATVATFPFRTR